VKPGCHVRKSHSRTNSIIFDIFWMKHFTYDSFAHQYFKELLASLGQRQVPQEAAWRASNLDFWFTPYSPELARSAKDLGLLKRWADTPFLLAPFYQAVTQTEIRIYLSRLLNVQVEFERMAPQDNPPIQEKDLPRLWIISPTVSQYLLAGFRARLDAENWLDGIYFLGDYLRTAVVVIDQLPHSKETLWLRILGNGTVQEQAIEELIALPEANRLRSNVIKLLTNWRLNLEMSKDLSESERELIRNLEPAFLEWRQEQVRQGLHFVIENLLRFRFGSLDDHLSRIIKPLLKLPPAESTTLLLQLSREELLARFGE